MLLTQLKEIRDFGPRGRTVGLSDETLLAFAERTPELVQAVDLAVTRHREFRESYPDILAMEEPAQVQAVLEGFVNFYAEPTVNPYVSLAAYGTWVVTLKGAVIHDSGGYGMLGLGHAPPKILQAMARPQVMANVMTGSLSQLSFVRALKREIGHRRSSGCPFERFVCLNSGSEAMTLAARLSDINARINTDPGGKHAGKTVKIAALSGGFHGRTDRPAQISDSCRKAYETHLASFRERDNFLTVVPNDIAGLRAMFAQAEKENWFIEALFIEPVMGEGNPGMATERAFYDAARELTRAHGSLLVADSIQAGLRAQGCLSIVDYPGYEDAEAPDIESYSKALNAGQYPLSVLALTEATAEIYRAGVYGNTMTTNPRAMDVACAVLEGMTPALRDNIRDRGRELVEKFKAVAAELDGAITGVQGTGLLASCALDPRFKCYGFDSVEEYLRINGIGVIHGGENSLRFTPHFGITSEEIDLIVEATRDALRAGAGTEQARVRSHQAQ